MYPEHEKLADVQKQSQFIGAFLDWLQNDRKLTICKLEDETWYPARISIENLLAEYFDIDLNVIESEKRMMLKELGKNE